MGISIGFGLIFGLLHYKYMIFFYYPTPSARKSDAIYFEIEKGASGQPETPFYV